MQDNYQLLLNHTNVKLHIRCFHFILILYLFGKFCKNRLILQLVKNIQFVSIKQNMHIYVYTKDRNQLVSKNNNYHS